MTQEVKVTMTIEADVTLDRTDIEQSIRQKDFELILIDDIKEEREIYQSDDLPKVVETRVYVVDSSTHNTYHLSDIEFKILAEGLGKVYDLKAFQEYFNEGRISYLDMIRFINIEL